MTPQIFNNKFILTAFLFSCFLVLLPLTAQAEETNTFEMEANDEDVQITEMTINTGENQEENLDEENIELIIETGDTEGETLEEVVIDDGETQTIEVKAEIEDQSNGTETIAINANDLLMGESSGLAITYGTDENIIELATTTIHLQIETFDSTLFDDDLIVTACPNSETEEENTLNIWCAIQQLGNEKNWEIFNTWSSLGVTYDIHQYKGNDFSDGMWWGWYTDNEPGMTGVNVHILSENENILLVYGVEPGKIKVSTTTPEINSVVDIEFQKFDWGKGWIPNSSSTFIINNEEYFDEDGIYNLEINTTTLYSVHAKKAGFIDSEILTITPIPVTNTTTSSTTDEDSGNNSNNNGNNNNTNTGENDETENQLISQDDIQESIDKILEYLKSKQDEDGKILDGNFTDFAIMSFATQGEYADDIRRENGKSLLDYEKEYNLDEISDMHSCASYPRHILTLLAAGVDKEDNAIQGLREKILNDCYNDHKYKEKEMKDKNDGTNDDIFALLALLAIDENIDEPIIIDLVKNIENSQNNENGGFSMGWGIGADATGASINALKYAEDKGFIIEQDIYSRAKDYLKSNQYYNGGWGYIDWLTNEPTPSILTTSWALMGINALEETQDDWFNSEGKNPWHPLVHNLTEEGYYELTGEDITPNTVDWFAMKHAVPALAGKSWPIILDPIVEDFSEGATFTYGGGGNGGTTYTPPAEEIATTTPTSTLDIITPTTTTDIVTITTDIATTTIDIDTPTTTTEISNNDVVEKKETEEIKINTSATNNQQSAIKTKTKKPIKKIEIEPITEQIKIDSSQLPPKEVTLSAVTPTSTTPIAKKVFGTSAALAGGLGLYLGWRFLLSLV